MITEEEQRLEDTANKQIKAMHEVLGDLKTAACVDMVPNEFYFFRCVEYAQVGIGGDLTFWSVDRRGFPDELQSFSLAVDSLLLEDQNVDDFKARFRAKWLPEFNMLRAQKRARLNAQIEQAQAELRLIPGDIK
jgi:hypothetical protein